MTRCCATCKYWQPINDLLCPRRVDVCCAYVAQCRHLGSDGLTRSSQSCIRWGAATDHLLIRRVLSETHEQTPHVTAEIRIFQGGGAVVLREIYGSWPDDQLDRINEIISAAQARLNRLINNGKD